VGVVVAMLLGGVAAAPIAAHVVRYVPARALGLAVAALLLATQTRELAGAAELGTPRWAAYALIPVVVALAGLRPRIERRCRPSEEPQLAIEPA